MRPVSNRRISREILINIINVSAFERRRGEGEARRGSFSPSSLRSRPSSSLAFPSRASFALDEGENAPPPAPPIIVNHRFPITLPRLFTLTLSLSLSFSLSLSLSLSAPFPSSFPTSDATRRSKVPSRDNSRAKLNFRRVGGISYTAPFNGRYRAALCHGALWDRRRKIGIIEQGLGVLPDGRRGAGIPVE